MQDNPTPSQLNSNNTDEIDLRELFAAIGRFFKRIGLGIVNVIVSLRRATRKFWTLLLAGILIGAALGYASYLAFRPYYASEIQITSEYYQLNTLENLIQGLNQLAEEENAQVLSKRLNISTEQAQNIRSFEVIQEINQEELNEAESLMLQIENNTELKEEELEEIRERIMLGSHSYTIQVSFYNPADIESLEKGLVYYLSSNEYISRRVTIDKNNLKELEGKLTADLQELQALKNLQAETLKRVIESGRTGSNNVIFGNPESATDPLNVYRQDIALYNDLLETKRELALNSSIEVINGFTPFQKPASISLIGKLVFGALIGLGIAYLLILLIGINRALNRYEAKNFTK